ncbi:MAG TPA: diacylglycerol kinase family protein [bacterium]|nr:diacylglycerol kinase family protein [bacterium]
MSSRPRLKLIVSPRATGCTPARIERLTAALAASHAVTVYELRGPGDYRNAVAPGDELVAVAGGDGTVREVATMLAGTDRRLAVIPAGTTNVIAIALGLRDDADAVARIRAGHARDWRMFRANGEPFMFCAGAGIDAETCRCINPALKARVRKLSYVAALLGVIARYDYPRFAADALPGRELTQAILLGCGYYAGARRLACSDPADAQLELLALSPTRLTTLAVLAALTMRGMRNPVTAVGSCSLTADAGARVPYQLDGDFAGYLPLQVEPAAVIRLIG